MHGPSSRRRFRCVSFSIHEGFVLVVGGAQPARGQRGALIPVDNVLKNRFRTIHMNTELHRRFGNRDISPGIELEMEVAGIRALFARPDSGAHPVSYPFPPPDAVRGMFEAVKYYHALEYVPLQIRVCKPVRMATYSFNYRGPYASADTQQVHAAVLTDVCWQFRVRLAWSGDRTKGDAVGIAKRLKDEWCARMEKGSARPMFLGHSQFMPSYYGPWRSSSVPIPCNEVVPFYTLSAWDKPRDGKFAPIFGEVEMIQGVVNLTEHISLA